MVEQSLSDFLVFVKAGHMECCVAVQLIFAHEVEVILKFGVKLSEHFLLAVLYRQKQRTLSLSVSQIQKMSYKVF